LSTNPKIATNYTVQENTDRGTWY